MLISKTFLSFSLIYEDSPYCPCPILVLRAGLWRVHEGFIHLFSLCSVICAAISFVPTPGNGGAAESSVSYAAALSSLAGKHAFLGGALCGVSFATMLFSHYGHFRHIWLQIPCAERAALRKLSSTSHRCSLHRIHFPGFGRSFSDEQGCPLQRMNEAVLLCCLSSSDSPPFKDCFPMTLYGCCRLDFPCREGTAAPS